MIPHTLNPHHRHTDYAVFMVIIFLDKGYLSKQLRSHLSSRILQARS